MKEEQYVQYEEFDKMDSLGIEEFSHGILQLLLYSPMHEDQLFRRLLVNEEKFNEVIELMMENSLIEEKYCKGKKYYGLTHKMRKKYGIHNKRFKFDNCYTRIDEKRKKVNIIYPKNGENLVIEMPLVKFLESIRADLKSLNIEIPIIDYEDYNADILTKPYKSPEPYASRICRLVTPGDRIIVLDRQDYKCNNCGCEISDYISDWENDKNVKVAHIDHIHPYVFRASYPNGPEKINELENLQGLCSDCNLKKHTRFN